MSAVRRANRSGARPSPYAKPPSKKSSWSISSILSYFLNPSKSSIREEIPIVMEDTDESDYSPEEHGHSPAEVLSTRGHQLSRKLKTQTLESQNPSQPTRQASGSPPPPSVSQQPETNPNLFIEPSSAAQGIDIVTSFLDSHRDRQISSIEAEGLISLLKKTETREPFRFSSSTPSTPQRGNSPLYASTNTTSVPFRFSTPTETSNQTSDTTAPKFLKYNPNGTYRWQGGGSAKPRSRNRYQSPAFGSSRAPSERLVLKESPEKIKTDTKRRRVGADAETSSASPSGSTSTQGHTRSPAPAPSPTRTLHAPPLPTPSVNGITSRVNGISAALPSSRLRTSVIQKPTTPVVPSPLRQAWGQSSPSISDGEGSPAPPQKQTKAANFMSELITQVTTTKHFEVSNPYQAASPVKAAGQAKPRSRRIRAGKANGAEPEGQAGKEKGREKDKEKQREVEKQYSAQAIIEATLPKGSKRSRPPPNSSGSVNGTSRLSASQSPPPSDSHETQPKTTGRFTAQVEEVEDEEEIIRIPKKAKPNGHGIIGSSANTLKSVPTIEEITGDELSSSKIATQPSEVIEPGRSVQEKPSFSLSNSGASSKPGPHVFGMPKSISIPKEPSKLRQSFKADTPPASSTSFPPSSTSPSPFSFTATPLTTPPVAVAVAQKSVLDPALHVSSNSDPKQAARDEPVTSLPTFTFTMPTSLSMKDVESMAQVRSAPISSLPKFDFNTPTVDSNNSLPTPPSSQPESSPVQAFDFEAAGLPALASGSWICKTCGCSSDTSATKCSVCDVPR